MISERDREVLSRLPVWNPASDIAAQRRAPNARICAGFHYRFSARVGSSMGREVGSYVAMHFDRSAHGP